MRGLGSSVKQNAVCPGRDAAWMQRTHQNLDSRRSVCAAAMMRCRPGTAKERYARGAAGATHGACGGPGSAVHRDASISFERHAMSCARVALHRIRDTQERRSERHILPENEATPSFLTQ